MKTTSSRHWTCIIFLMGFTLLSSAQSQLTLDNATLQIGTHTLTLPNRPGQLKIVFNLNTPTQILPPNWQIDISYQLVKRSDGSSSGLQTLQLGSMFSNRVTDFRVHPVNASDYDLQIATVTRTGSTPTSVTLEASYLPGTSISSGPIPTPRLRKGANKIFWTPGTEVAYYELEWVFVDQYAPVANPFKELDPVRIVLTHTDYPYSLNYPSGKVHYRVRAVMGNPNTGETMIQGTWSNIVEVSITQGIEYRKNWQSVTLLAEEGKRKDLITYYDGANRARQSLSVLNADSSAIVQDHKYDYESRETISLLPTPIAGTSLQHQPAFNTYHGSTYAAHHMLPNNLLQLDTTSGTGKYFSGENTLGGIHRDYIPHAEGFPFSSIEYKRDPSGKIAAKSAYGKDLRLKNGHDTQYYYGDASGIELFRLFGSNAGQSKFYKKEISRDPNSQFKVLYYDQADRIVASASAGTYPGTDLDNIYTTTGDILTANLMESNTINLTTNTSTAIKKILNVVATNYDFKYDLTSLSYRENVTDFGTTFCTTCKYDLTIRILDPNQNVVNLNYNGQPIVSKRIDPATTFCNTSTASSQTYSEPQIAFSVNFNQVGEYTIIKELKLIEGVIDADLQRQIENHIPATRTTIRTREASSFNPEICSYSCEAYCGSMSTQECRDWCAQQQTGNITQMLTDECTNQISLLKMDFREGGWIYEDRIMLTSIVNAAYAIYSYPLLAGVNTTNVYTRYHTSWPELLYRQHPEYKLVAKCSLLTNSRKFDIEFSSTSTHVEAVAKGYLQPVPIDPYFNDPLWGERLSAAGVPEYKRKIINKLNNFFEDPPASGTYISLLEFVSRRDLLYGNDEIRLDNLCRPLPTDLSSVPLDLQWQLFKGIYLGLKANMHERILNNEYNTFYFNDPRAHFKKPVSISDPASVEFYRDQMTASFCEPMCDARARAWIVQLQEHCTLTQPTIDQLVPYLKEFCKQNCTAGNLFIPLTQEALASHPSLQNAQIILGACALDSIAQPTHENYTEICREKCSLVCQAEYLKALISAPTNTIDLSKDKDLLKCLDTLKLTTALFKRDKNAWFGYTKSQEIPTCIVQIKDELGNVIQPHTIASIVSITRVSSAPTSAGTSLAPPFMQLKLLLQLTDGSQKVGYPYSSCSLPKKCEPALKPDHVTLTLFQAVVAALKSNTYDSPSAAVTVTPKGIQVCRKVFVDSVNLKQKNWKCDNCLWQFYDDRGNIVTITSKSNVGTPFTNDPPSVMPASAIAYSGLAVWIRTGTPWDGKKQKAFIFTSCKIKWIPDCYLVPNCITDELEDFPSPEDRCRDKQQREIEYRTEVIVSEAATDFTEEQRSIYFNKCFSAPFNESFTADYALMEYNYTLYYYDLAGNLTQTVSPKGVRITTSTTDPAHTMPVVTKYNSRNQVTEQATPDAGMNMNASTTKSWYNKAGLPRFTQTEEQRASNKYSFTKYDAQRRVIAVGEVNALSDVIIQSNLEVPDFPDEATYTLTHLIKTIYDYSDVVRCPSFSATNLRGRVAVTLSMPNKTDITCATCYSYDPQGNVNMLMQNITGLGPKRFYYAYDLVTGNINSISYQTGQPDQYFQKFEYDADNRMTHAFTSRDGFIWDNDIRYFYYKHGPLARMELGEESVQGIDYVYTINGWPKAINANTLAPNRDPGRDGNTTPGNPNGLVAADAIGISYGYFTNDYKPILFSLPSANSFQANRSGSGFLTESNDLFNGNITHMVKAIHGGAMYGESYRYDQLYRIKRSLINDQINTTTNQWLAGHADNNFESQFNYDPNGNILSLNRKANGTGNRQRMDEMVYYYASNKNLLLHVRDNINPSRFPDDFDNTTAFNPSSPPTQLFAYDRNGNLTRDKSAGVQTLEWNPYNRVSKIFKEPGTGSHIDFLYDGANNRIAKFLRPQANSLNASTWDRNYYVRDASGEVMATYRINGGITILKDLAINGVRRFGLWNVNQNLSTGPPPMQLVRGQKEYELTDHLNNVLATVSDLPTGIDANGDSQIDSYQAQIFTRRYYYPYGMPMPIGSFGSYRYGFNAGSEIDSEISSHPGRYFSTDFRGNDTYIARWWSPDPKINLTPFQSPYISMDGDPVLKNDPNGDIVPLLLGAWAVIEVGLAVYDVYDAGSTLLDDNASTLDKSIAVGGLALGALLPGGGYGTAGKQAAKQVEKQIVKEAAQQVEQKLLKETAEEVEKKVVKETVEKVEKEAIEESVNVTEKKVAQTTKDPLSRRVKLREETKKAVRDAAPKTSDGRYIDPNTRLPIEKGQEAFGHKPGKEWKNYKKDPANKSKSRKEVIEDQNDPSIYQIEDRSSNSSHKYEKKD